MLDDEDCRLLRQVAAGRTTAEIAANLEVSGRTVRRRVLRARATLGARTDVHAVVLALRGGLL
jgi:DNA-binding CsgD family transcriptional regulator